MSNEKANGGLITSKFLAEESKNALGRKIADTMMATAGNGQSAVRIKLPGAYDVNLVDLIIADLKRHGYQVERKHSTDELYISWMLSDIPGI